MNSALIKLVSKIDDPRLTASHVIPWSSPVPSFGDWTSARLATVGINPSNREFVDAAGRELQGGERRFHTLGSLNLANWSLADNFHLESIVKLCKGYFGHNPYDSWFKKLDYLISGADYSYYFPSYSACHLDLIPYATGIKWMDLSPFQRKTLLSETGNILGYLVRDSAIQLLVLNGKSVVENFKKITDIQLVQEHMPTWTLPRRGVSGVQGYSFQGRVSEIGGVDLMREIPVLGYNHNIQSSFGVTSEVLLEMRRWIAYKTNEMLT